MRGMPPYFSAPTGEFQISDGREAGVQIIARIMGVILEGAAEENGCGE
jgi:hypothetical protein